MRMAVDLTPHAMEIYQTLHLKLSILGTDWVTEVLARGRTSGLMDVHRTNSSKETIKRAEHSCCGSCA